MHRFFCPHKTFHSYGVLPAFETASYKHGTPTEFFTAQRKLVVMK
jgi:hypothetical protein